MYTKRAGKYVSKRQSFKITLILFAPRFIKPFEKKNEKKKLLDTHPTHQRPILIAGVIRILVLFTQQIE